MEHDELDWLAFRYVAGEMDAAQMRAFEMRLDEAQDAREAVARAVELANCIAVAERERTVEPAVSTTARRRWRLSNLAAASIGLAGCLLLALATLRLPRLDPSTSTSALSDADQLAVIWSETRQPLDDPLWPPDQLDEDTFETPVAMADLSADSSWIGQAVWGLEND